MSATIADLSSYGDVKGRDSYARHILQSVKGDGATANSVTQGFFGIPSATEVEYEMARLTVSEGTFDDEIGTVTFGVRDGAALNDVMSLNNVLSEITATTFTMNATDVYSTGILNVATIQENSLAEGSRIELVSDASIPNINFVLGDLAGTPSVPLIISEGVVAVTGSLTIDGTDVGALITGGNPWDPITTTTIQTKDGYTTVEIGFLDSLGDPAAHSTGNALDINGTIRVRGNDVVFYDSVGTTHYSALHYDDTTANTVTLQSSRAGDSLVLSTTNAGGSNMMSPRFTLDDGAATTNALFSNVFVGINTPAPSGTYSLEITGNAFVSTGLTSTADIDLVGNNLVNVTELTSSDTLAEQARIVLTGDIAAGTPMMELFLGDLTGALPTATATWTEDLVTITPVTTFSTHVIVGGDLTVQGDTITFNTATVSVEDLDIHMGNGATDQASSNGGGIILGPETAAAGEEVISLLYSSADNRWESTVGVNVATGHALSVGTTTEIIDGEVSLNTDSAFFYFGATKQWRLGTTSDVDGDHFVIAHDDLGTGVTWVTKLDILQ